MSLLNEALRKKSGERPSSLQPPLPPSRRRRKTRPRPAIMAVLLAVGICGGVLIWWTLLPQEQPAVSPVSHRPGTRTVVAESNRTLKAPDHNTDREPLPASPAERTAADASRTPEKALVPADAPSPGNNPTTSRAIEAVPTRAKRQAPIPQRKDETAAIPKPTTPVASPEAPFMEKALSYHRQGLTDKSITMYREVLRQNPGHHDALVNLTSLLITGGRFTEALSLLRRHTPEASADPLLYLHMAIAEIGLQQPHKALEHLARAEALGAETFELLFHRGVAHSQVGDVKQAVASYKKAEELQSDHTALFFNLALALDKGQQYAEALTYYQKFLDRVSGENPQRAGIEKRVDTLRAYVAIQ